MRTRLIAIAIVIVVAVAVGVAALGRDGKSATPGPRSALAARTMEAGAVTVKVAPHHIDATGAEFEVTIDTHSQDLAMDLADGAELVVGGTRWPVQGWDGDGPSGHHRAGTLRFGAGGPPSGAVEITLDGFASPVSAGWRLGG